MFKKYDHRLVHSYKSYTIKEICRLFKPQNLHDKTVRAWIKSGHLEAILDGNKLLVYGAILKQFIKRRNKNRQRILALNEFLCFSCKETHVPFDNTIFAVTVQNNGSIMAFALCPNCAFEMKRLYKRSEISEIKNLFNLKPAALIVLSDISCNTYNAHPQADQKSLDPESQLITVSCITHNAVSTNNLISTKVGE